jgi:hypothetical protein
MSNGFEWGLASILGERALKISVICAFSGEGARDDVGEVN